MISSRLSISILFIVSCLTACVDLVELPVRATNDIIVVDGMVTSLPEPQIIRLNRSRADPVTGRFGTLPVTKAVVSIVVDSMQTIAAHETVDGSYQMPSDFRGIPGHAYQLRISLPEGTSLQSTRQNMPGTVPIQQTKFQFSQTSLPVGQYSGFRAGHDVSITTQDPVGTRNYYRWDLLQYEKQEWCRSCTQGVYAVFNIIPRSYMFGNQFVSGTELFEDCFAPTPYGDFFEPPIDKTYYNYDYACRTQCWEIVRSYTLNLFDDINSNGGLINQRKIGQVPYLTYGPCLAVIRQSSLTAGAYQFYKLLEEQTQNSGGVADIPPTALVGNIAVTTGKPVSVVGFFAANAVSEKRQWLDRKDTQGIPLGAIDSNGAQLQENEILFYALNQRRPSPEPPPPYTGIRQQPKILIFGGPPRVPTAICVPSDTRTPFMPEGWRQ
jgi:hypothetical protein